MNYSFKTAVIVKMKQGNHTYKLHCQIKQINKLFSSSTGKISCQFPNAE